MVTVDQNWLAERRLAPQWSVVVSGLVNVGVVLGLAIALWWLFFAVEGVFKLYTPLLGFAIMIWMLLILLWQTEILDLWPLKRDFLRSSSSVSKGLLLTALCLLLLVVIVFGLIYGLIGRYGVTYFNWNSLASFGQLGQDPTTSRETASWAIIALSVPFFWLTVLTMVGLRNDLWPGLKPSRQGVANLLWISGVSIPLFCILFHPHIGSMFYPAQVYTAVPPWWKAIAQTNSAEFNMGWVFCIVVVIFYTLHLWGGRPWSLVGRQPWRFLFLLFGSFLLGAAMFSTELGIMNHVWDEAYIGGQNEANFGWRYGHTTTMAAFILVPAIMLNYLFSGAFDRLGTVLKGALMSLISILIGLGFAWLYYTAAPALLGVNSGVSHPSENPTVFLLLVINLLVIQHGFFDGWPGYRLKK
jgi:amino acid transporter, AAT family